MNPLRMRHEPCPVLPNSPELLKGDIVPIDLGTRQLN